MTDSDPGPEKGARQLGVIEAFTVVINQCPSGAVRRCAEQALEAVKSGGAEVLREQAYFVLTAMRGWRGDKATQVHTSLAAFLEQSEAKAAADDAGAATDGEREKHGND